MATTVNPRLGRRSVNRRDALLGAARLMDVGGTLTRVHRPSSSRPSIESSLASDWMRVGDSFRAAFQKFERDVNRGGL